MKKIFNVSLTGCYGMQIGLVKKEFIVIKFIGGATKHKDTNVVMDQSCNLA